MFTCGPNFFVASGGAGTGGVPSVGLLTLDYGYRGEPYVVVVAGTVTDPGFRGEPVTPETL